MGEKRQAGTPKLTFRPVISKRMALSDAAIFVAALKASHRFVVLETPRTISFTFYKKPRRRDVRLSTADPGVLMRESTAADHDDDDGDGL